MRIVLSDGVLAAENNKTDLIGFLQRALHGRCYLSVADRSSATHTNWLQQLDVYQRDAWTTALDLSDLDSATYRLPTICVEQRADSDWSPPRPFLNVVDATRLIDRTKRIWVENSRNDRQFWLAMVRPETKRYIERLEQAGIIEFANGGGISELRKIVEDRLAGERDRSQANWILFDSDAPLPGQPSTQARQLRAQCEAAAIRHFELERRAIENYLPKDALYAFANARLNRDSRNQSRARMDAFFRMSPEQRHHFPMKAGFRSITSADELAFYASVNPDDQATLEHGIARNVADQFRELGPERIYNYASREGGTHSLERVMVDVLNSFRAPGA